MNNHFVYKDALGKTSHHVQFKWLKRLCGGVGGDSVVSHWREDGVFWTVPEQPPPPSYKKILKPPYVGVRSI